MNRCVNKALARGVEAALEDLPRSGRPREISDEAIAWVIGVACTKPVELGYASGAVDLYEAGPTHQPARPGGGLSGNCGA